ncbi:MAG: SlyX family protein [Mariniblastus sp.]
MDIAFIDIANWLPLPRLAMIQQNFSEMLAEFTGNETMDPNEHNAKRLTNLETSLMHLQSDYDSLNEVVLDNARRLDKMAAMLQRLTEKFEAASEPVQERNAEDEKPPHY